MVFRSSLKWLVMIAVLPMVLAACGGAGSSPDGTVEACFKVMADGDQEAMSQYFVPSVREKMKSNDPKAMQMLKAMGGAFEGIKKSEVDGDKAKVWVNLDEDKMVEAMMALMEGQGPGNDKQAQFKQMMTDVMRKSAKEMENQPISLVKQDGSWLIDEMK